MLMPLIVSKSIELDVEILAGFHILRGWRVTAQDIDLFRIKFNIGPASLLGEEEKSLFSLLFVGSRPELPAGRRLKYKAF